MPSLLCCSADIEAAADLKYYGKIQEKNRCESFSIAERGVLSIYFPWSMSYYSCNKLVVNTKGSVDIDLTISFQNPQLLLVVALSARRTK